MFVTTSSCQASRFYDTSTSSSVYIPLGAGKRQTQLLGLGSYSNNRGCTEKFQCESRCQEALSEVSCGVQVTAKDWSAD